YGQKEWSRFWSLARTAGADPAAQNLVEQRVQAESLRVRTRGGAYRPLNECLLPGKVVGSGDEDAEITVDIEFHRADVGLLDALGRKDGPRLWVDPSTESWSAEYREQAIQEYSRALPPTASRPYKNTLVVEGPTPAGPLCLLTRLSRPARARFLQAIP